MQFTKPETSGMQIQHVPWQVALQWTACPWAFPSGWGQNKKALARDTSTTMQPTDTDPAAIPLQCISHAPVTKSSPVFNLWTRLGPT